MRVAKNTIVRHVYPGSRSRYADAQLPDAGKRSSSAAGAAPDGATQQGALKPPPIPEAGPLVRPKSLRQVGVPEGATRAVIPPDNLQTPEKIALGLRLFFDGRRRLRETVKI
jgi:hypothetical protein